VGLSPPVRQRPHRRQHPAALVSSVPPQATREACEVRALGLPVFFLHRGTTGLSASSYPLRATLAVGPCTRNRNPGTGPGLLRPSWGNKKPGAMAGFCVSLLNTRRNDRM